MLDMLVAVPQTLGNSLGIAETKHGCCSKPVFGHETQDWSSSSLSWSSNSFLGRATSLQSCRRVFLSYFLQKRFVRKLQVVTLFVERKLGCY